ncbi:hypothetical protein LSH36_598g03011 [Paralvinella palmiformis]|uniref:THAP-type domain-containing protein n=1 Tax=Paralvinella palmiformis TaxID=53620 RepID=A0AAD9J540_9ANNE|nr:hypothetical protein LSH36_598g03011 [Paralvinella palmiformis]
MRRFYAHWFHDGCPKDRGWITVLDDLEGYCDWERNGIRPSLMYCSGNTDCLFAVNRRRGITSARGEESRSFWMDVRLNTGVAIMRGTKCQGGDVNKSPKQHRDWLVNLRREGLTPTTFTILCSVNFEDNCFDITGNTRWLHANAVPTKFDFPPHLQKSKPNRKLPVTVTSTRIRGSECGPSSEGHPLITIILDHPYDIRKSPSK